MGQDVLRKMTMRPQTSGLKNQGNDVMNVVNGMTLMYLFIIISNADIVEELVSRNNKPSNPNDNDYL